MKRRDLFYKAAIVLGFFAIKKISVAHSGLSVLSAKNLRQKQIQLSCNASYIAQPHALFELPRNPKNGDYVQLIVDQSSIANPCTLKGNQVNIIGENEPLVLDSMAILRLTYDAKNKNWKHI